MADTIEQRFPIGSRWIFTTPGGGYRYSLVILEHYPTNQNLRAYIQGQGDFTFETSENVSSSIFHVRYLTPRVLKSNLMEE